MVKLLVYAVPSPTRVASPVEPAITLELFGRDHVTSRDVPVIIRSFTNKMVQVRDVEFPTKNGDERVDTVTEGAPTIY